MRNKLNQSRFQGIARAMTRNYGVNVVFGGTGPKTDGRTIWLPANADSLPGHAQDSLEGWLDHEACHVEEEVRAEQNGTTSPMALMGGEAARLGPRAQLLLNVYEDIRIENAKAESHPGVAENLRTVNERSIKRYLAGSTGDVWQDIAGAIIATGRGLDTSWVKGGVKVIIDLIQDELAQTAAMTSPDDAFRLAKSTLEKISSLIPEAQEEQDKRDEPEPEGDEDQDGEDGEGGEGQDQSEDSDEGDDAGDAGEGQDEGDESEDSDDTQSGSETDEDGDGEGDDSDAQDGDEGSEDASEGSEDGDGDEDGEDEGQSKGEGSEDSDDASDEDGEGGKPEGSTRGVEDLEDSELEDLVEALEEAEDTDPENTDFINHTKTDIDIKAAKDAKKNERCIAPADVVAQDGLVEAPKVTEAGAKDYQETKADVNDQIGNLKRRLSTVLRARQQVHFVGDKEDGTLDQAALFTLKTGGQRVFAQRTTADQTNTVVQLLIDLSGSMGSGDTIRDGSGKAKARQNRAWYAKRTAVALAETLDAIGVPFEVLGFYSSRSSVQSRPMAAGCSRHGAFHIVPIKLFSEGLRRVRARFQEITGRGCNGDGDAVMFAAKRIAQRPEDRKLLIVISDGQPAGPADHSILEADLKRVITEVTASGIEVYGIGANNHAVKDYYNEAHGASHIVIDDLSKLATSVFKLLRSKLLKRTAA